MSRLENHDQHVSKGLALFSLALGVVELFAPRMLSRAIGLNIDPAFMRFLGLREIASEVGMLMQPTAPLWPRARVAGDAMDLAVLALAPRTVGASSSGMLTAAAAVVGVAAIDLYASQRFGGYPLERDFIATAGIKDTPH